MFDRRDDFLGVNEEFSPAELTEYDSGDGTRTHDLHRVKAMLSQLS